MITNPLYYVVSNTDFKSLPKSLGNMTRKFGKYKDEEPYALIDLPKECLKIGTLELTSHHITFFEYDRRYHYTAYFKNDHGSNFRIHVYFDSHDELSGLPIFDLRINDTDYEKQKDSNHNEDFLKLAEAACEAVINYLRERQKDLLKKHKKELNRLDKKAEELSTDLHANKESYLKICDEQLKQMRHIQHYSSNPDQVYGRINLLNSLKTSVENLKFEEIIELESDIQSPIQSIDSFEISNSSKTSKKPTKHACFTKEQFNKLQESYKNYKRPVDLTTTYNDIQILEWQFDKEDLKAIPEIKEDIKQLKLEIIKSGNKELHQCLKDMKLEQAILLRPFYASITPQTLFLALQNNNSKLLKFLIEQELFTADHKNFEFNDIKYTSLVDFCFKNDSNKKSLSDCYETLVQNGASLFGISHISKLPHAAAILLLDSQHPFRQVFERHIKFTAKNLKFYKQLNQLLEQWLKKANCDEDTIHKVTLLFKRNDKFINAFNEVRNIQQQIYGSNQIDKNVLKATGKYIDKYAESIVGIAAKHGLESDVNKPIDQSAQAELFLTTLGFFSDVIQTELPKELNKLKKNPKQQIRHVKQKPKSDDCKMQ